MQRSAYSRLPLLLCSPLGAVILFAVLQRGPVSRADLARILGHSRSKMSEEVEDLLAQNLLREVGMGQTTGGRPPVLVEFNYGAGGIMAIELGAHYLHVAVTDLGGRILQEQREPLLGPAVPRRVLPRLIALMHDLLHRGDHEANPLVLGIGVSFPGQVSPRNGRILHSFSLPGWTDINVKAVLEREFDCPASIATHANVRALAEWQFGIGRTAPEFLYITAGPPTMSSLVTAHALHTGSHGVAGQLGHVVIEPAGRPCVCGKNGCLDTELARIVKRIPSRRRSGREAPETPAAVLAGALDAASGQAATTVAIVQAYSTALARALSPVISVFDPAVIVLGGHAEGVTELLAETVSVALREHGLPAGQDRIDIRPSRIGLDSGIRGASVLVVQELLMHNAEMSHTEGVFRLAV